MNTFKKQKNKHNPGLKNLKVVVGKSTFLLQLVKDHHVREDMGMLCDTSAGQLVDYLRSAD